MAANCLPKMMHLAQRNSQITGLIPHLIDRRVAILQYGDGTIMFIHDDLDSARNLKFAALYV